MRAEWISLASVIIALGSLLYSRRNSRTGLQSLDVAAAIAQLNYENARAGHSPAATLTLTEVEHRPATARDLDGIIGSRARAELASQPDHLEVVARGQLSNNTSQELLLTLHDHPRSGRNSWREHLNQSAFLLGGNDVHLSQAVLPAGATMGFEWIDRRHQHEWITIHGLNDTCDGTSSPLMPRLSWRDFARAPFDSFERLRRRRIARSGFYLVCEPRTTERVATIWHAEVVTPPVAVSDWDSVTERSIYEPSLRTIAGPIDDDIIRYRVTFDAVLALLRPPKMRYLRGRN